MFTTAVCNLARLCAKCAHTHSHTLVYMSGGLRGLLREKYIFFHKRRDYFDFKKKKKGKKKQSLGAENEGKKEEKNLGRGIGGQGSQ